ncbi:MAG: hypothetical protein RSC57_03310, partial [Bacilli bacterium]
AGILAFALIGFIVQSKKKDTKKSDEGYESAPVENDNFKEVPVTPEVKAPVLDTVETLNPNISSENDIDKTREFQAFTPENVEETPIYDFSNKTQEETPVVSEVQEVSNTEATNEEEIINLD